MKKSQKVVKRVSSKARLERFINTRLTSAIKEINDLVSQTNERVLALLDKLADDALTAVGGTIKQRRAIKLAKVVGEKMGKVGEKNSQPVENDAHTSDRERKKMSGEKLFLNTLKEIGKPAMTFEIGDRLRKTNPEAKRFAKNKKDLMQMIYNSASSLAKAGVIERKAVGKRTFEYSLREWDGNKATKPTATTKKTAVKGKRGGRKLGAKNKPKTGKKKLAVAA